MTECKSIHLQKSKSICSRSPEHGTWTAGGHFMLTKPFVASLGKALSCRVNTVLGELLSTSISSIVKKFSVGWLKPAICYSISQRRLCCAYFVRPALRRLQTVGPVCLHCLPHHPKWLVRQKSNLLEKPIDPLAAALEQSTGRVP